MDQVNEIMKKKMGDFETGTTYLIGDDYLMRSGEPSAVLKTRVNTVGAERWLNGRSGTARYTNYQGEKVLGVNYNLESLEKLGIRWGLLAEINEAKAFGPSRSLLFMVGIMVLVTIVIVSLISILATRRT